MPTVRDEASSLLPLYTGTLSLEEEEVVVQEHFRQFGRFGFCYTYFPVEARRQFLDPEKYDLEGEKNFIQGILSHPELETIIASGHEHAQRVLPEKAFYEPTTTFLIDTASSAMVGEHNSYDINISRMWRGKKDRSIEAGLANVENYAAHEGNHIFLRQLRGRFKRDLTGKAFSEGLARLAQPRVKEQRDVDLDYWVPKIRQLESPQSSEEQLALLQEIAQHPDVAQRHSQKILLPNYSKEDMRDRYHKEANRLLYQGSGVLYDLGLQIWQTIEQAQGIDRVKELSTRPIREFIREYHRSK